MNQRKTAVKWEKFRGFATNCESFTYYKTNFISFALKESASCILS